MKWGLITDTHARLPLIRKAITIFEREKCEAVFHAGDFDTERAWRLFLQQSFSFYFVTDHKSHDRFLKNNVPNLDIRVNAARVAMYHDTYQPVIIDGREFGVRSIILDGRYDFVFYGHLHYFNIKLCGGADSRTVVVNSGGFYHSDLSTFAILDTDASSIRMFYLFENEFVPVLRFKTLGTFSDMEVLHEAAACCFADALSRLRWQCKDRWEYAFTDFDNELWFCKNYKKLFDCLDMDDKPAFFYS